jgi:hypothetical protein
LLDLSKGEDVIGAAVASGEDNGEGVVSGLD